MSFKKVDAISETANSGFISTPHALCTAGLVVGTAGASGGAVMAAAALPTQALGLMAAAAGCWAGGEMLVDEDKRILLKGLKLKKQKADAPKVVDVTPSAA